MPSEDTNELGNKTMALGSTGANVTEFAKKPSEDREEGELSSAENLDDDDNNSIEVLLSKP